MDEAGERTNCHWGLERRGCSVPAPETWAERRRAGIGRAAEGWELPLPESLHCPRSSRTRNARLTLQRLILPYHDPPLPRPSVGRRSLFTLCAAAPLEVLLLYSMQRGRRHCWGGPGSGTQRVLVPSRPLSFYFLITRGPVPNSKRRESLVRRLCSPAECVILNVAHCLCLSLIPHPLPNVTRSEPAENRDHRRPDGHRSNAVLGEVFLVKPKMTVEACPQQRGQALRGEPHRMQRGQPASPTAVHN